MCVKCNSGLIVGCVCNPSGIVDNVYNKTFEGETYVDFRTLKQAIAGKLQSFLLECFIVNGMKAEAPLQNICLYQPFL